MQPIRETVWSAEVGSAGVTSAPPIRVALTFDDAPTSCEPGLGISADARRMDAVRDTLEDRGIRHCIAFAVGERVVGSEAVVERWLDAGFELGNHSQHHRRASDLSTREFAGSLRDCDRVLEGLGAFSGSRPRLFRYPFLDTGRDEPNRQELRQVCQDHGYEIVPVTVETFDYAFESALAHHPSFAPWLGRRFACGAVDSLQVAQARLADRFGGPIPQIALIHFGGVASRFLTEFLNALEVAGAEWISIAEAMLNRAVRDFADSAVRGCLTDSLPIEPTEQLLRRLGSWSARLGILGERFAGPAWPRRQRLKPRDAEKTHPA